MLARFTSFSFVPKDFFEVILLFISLTVCCLILTYQCKTNNDEDLFYSLPLFGIVQALESVIGGCVCGLRG